MGRALATLTANRVRYMEWSSCREPLGAPADQWIKWAAWRAARRDMFDAEIFRMQQVERNYARRKHEYNKRDRNPNRRGR